MIVTDNGMTMIKGEHSEVICDILTMLEAINKAVEKGDIDNQDLYAMVSTAPEVITKFCNNLTNSIHK